MSVFEKFTRALEVPHPPNEIRATALVSHDVKPIEIARRTWGWPAFAGLWATVAFNMSGFQLGSALLAVGLNWWQTLIATLIGHFFGAAYVVAMSMPGLRYQLSFPVTNRLAWGHLGSYFVILNRILLTIVSTGVQNYLGGLVTYCLLRALWPSIDNLPNNITAPGLTTPTFIGVMVYFCIQFPLLWLNPKNMALLFDIGGAVGFITMLVLVIWACATRGEDGFGATLSNESTLSSSQLGWRFLYGISFTISSVTGGSVAICDFARYSRGVPGGVWPQAVGWFPTWISSTFGVLTIAATQIRYGAALWSVPSLLIAIQTANPNSATRCAMVFCSLGFITSQLALNVASNAFAGGVDLSGLFPKFINVRRGSVIMACLGLLINPWYLLSSAVIFITVFSSYTVFIQPFMGIMIAQYFVVSKGRFKVSDLYVTGPSSIYWYTFGFNWRAVISWTCGVVISLPGFLIQVGVPLQISDAAVDIYYLCGLTGALISFLLTIGLDYLFPVPAQKAWINSVTFKEALDLKEEYILSLEMGSHPASEGSSQVEQDRTVELSNKEKN